MTSSQAVSTTTSRASGRPAWTARWSRPSRRPASRTCRSSAPTVPSSSSPLLDPAGYAGLEGAAVTNTAAVGGAGVNLAVKLLNGETVQTVVGFEAEYRPAGSGRRRQPDRRRQGHAPVLACRRSRSALAAWPHDRWLDHLHPRTGHPAAAARAPAKPSERTQRRGRRPRRRPRRLPRTHDRHRPTSCSRPRTSRRRTAPWSH